MRKIYLKQKKELSSNKKYFLFSFFISIYVFLPQILASSGIKSIFVSFIVLFLLAKVNKVIFIIISFFTLVTNIIILHIFIHWGSSAIVPRIQAAMLSPNYETLEYLNTYIGVSEVFIFIYFLVGMYLFYQFLLGYKHSYRIIKTTSISLLLIIVFILVNIHKLKSLLPYTYIDKIALANEWKVIVDKRKEYLKKQIHMKKDGNLFYDKIIIIMGESVNKHHMSIYDYSVSTTPFLSNLVKQNNTFKFNNIISPSNQTRYSVPLNLTDATVKHFYDFITSKSIIDNFKDYAYKTYWLSNQFSEGMHDSYISSIANESDFSFFTNFVYEHGGYADTQYDLVLLEQLDKIKIKKDTKELFIFHLLGSHFQYQKRYPANEALFKKPKNIIEKYDNTIYYTDYVIHQIFNKFKNTKFLFIYLSDHAEVVDLKKSGHGYFPTYKDEYDVPLVIHSSIENNRLLKLKKLNETLLFNMESFNYIVKYLVGMENNLKKISHEPYVIALDPINIENYKVLNAYENELNIEKD